jgi:hypothetical protein
LLVALVAVAPARNADALFEDLYRPFQSDRRQ